ncbi:MAG: glucose-6-phosphate dehydrogenase [Candidatus Moraniibacteriota bacterium]
MPNKNRKSNRLENFDYSQNGMYFVTICTKNREHYFGEIVNGKMILNELGKITENVWKNLPHHYLNIKLDTYTIMPNHFHCIIEIVGTGFVRTGFKPVLSSKNAKQKQKI